MKREADRAYDWSEAGKRMQGIREFYGISRRRLAKELGCTEKHCTDIEGGKAGMGTEILAAAARFFCVSPDYILTGKTKEPGLAREKGEEELLFEILDHLEAGKRRLAYEAVRGLARKEE